jgi:tetratricopeptide (TPR) repeat protein
MSKQIANNLFIDFSSERLYKRLLYGKASYAELGNQILLELKSACAFRLVERVRELSIILTNFPVKEYQLIGQYYLVWCQGRESKYNTDTLERIIEQTKTYKTKAMFSLAAFEGFQGRIRLALYYYTEALKTSPSISEYIDLSRGIAALKSFEGFHRSAIRDLENLIPYIKYSEPLTYYDFLNSYSVELSEQGRKEEARNISRLVLASPFAYAYPEWQETANDLRESSRSFVVIDPSPANAAQIYSMPLAEKREATKQDRPASVTNLQQWKKKMGKDNGEETNIDDMSDKDIFMEIMHLSSQETITRKELQQILDAVKKITSKKN